MFIGPGCGMNMKNYVGLGLGDFRRMVNVRMFVGPGCGMNMKV